MRILIVLFLVLFLFFTACRKDKSYGDRLEGIWVEKSLRLDTLDFDVMNRIDHSGPYPMVSFLTNRYSDPVLNPVYPVTHTDIYTYYFSQQRDSIYMLSSLSSLYRFNPYSFSMYPGGRKFSVQKFYGRRSLPDLIEFVRIQ